MNRKTYYEPILKLYITGFVDSDSKRAHKTAERIIGEPLDVGFEAQAKTIEYTSSQGGQRLVLWLRRRDGSLLAHELIHVVEYCFERRRIPFNLESSEFVAYYVEHLFRIFEPLLVNSSKKKK